MAHVHQYDLFLLNEARQPIFQIDSYKKVEIIRRFNDVSTWLIEMEEGAFDVSLFDWRGGIRLLRDGVLYFEGIPGTTDDSDIDLASGTLQFAGFDYMTYLKERLVVSVPAGPPYSTSAYHTITGPAENVLKDYVRYHLGSLAKVARQVSGLSVSVNTGTGTTVTGKGRFETLLELLQDLAVKGGDLGFYFDGLDFKVYQPVDRSATVRFSRDFGNLGHYRRRQQRPQANFIIAGGGGELTAREFVEATDGVSVAEFGRIEWFYDYRNYAGADLTAAAQAKIEELAQKITVELDVIDTEGIQFVRDYNLGDKVRVVIPRLSFVETIRSIKLVLDNTGEHVTPVVGTPGSEELSVLNTLFKRSSNLTDRVSQLERR